MSTSPDHAADASLTDAEDSAGATVMAPPHWTAAELEAASSKKRPRLDPNVGTILSGKYRLERPVGHGGTGRVYVATQLSLGRTVAVKILRPELESESVGEQFAERFVREASLAGSLSHPNVVTVHDYGRDDDGTCYIVMELVEGCSLKELMRSGPMDPERALDLFVQVARGLRHAHRAGLVHRDVKPGNVQITPGDDGREVAKLLDFGLVKSDLPEVTEITREGSFLGTPHYASPEQVRGEEADARSDLYGLGIMLYRAFTGVLPYYSKSSMALAMAHVRDPYPVMAERVPGIRVEPSHEAIVRRLMEKDASRRYPDADALLVDLEAALRLAQRDLLLPDPVGGDAPLVSDAEPSVLPSTRPSTPRGSPALIAAIASLALLVVGGAVWLGMAQSDGEVVVRAAPREIAAPQPEPAEPAKGDWSAEVLVDATPVALQVALASEPSGAEVWVDGKPVGETPWVGSLAVDDGVHQTLRLRKDGYHEEEVSLALDNVAASATVALRRVAPPPQVQGAQSRPAAQKPKRPTPAPSSSAPKRTSPPPRAAGGGTVDGVAFTAEQATRTLQLANTGAVEAFHAAGIRTQEFNRVKAGRPYRSLKQLADAPGVGAKTLQRMRDSKP